MILIVAYMNSAHNRYHNVTGAIDRDITPQISTKSENGLFSRSDNSMGM